MDNGIEVNNAPEGRIVMVVIHVYYFFFFIVFQGSKSYTVQSVRSFVRLYCHNLTNLEYFQLRKRLKRKMLSVSYIIEQKTNSANYLLASAQIDLNFCR